MIMIVFMSCEVANISMCYECNYNCCVKVSNSEVGIIVNVVSHVAYG